MGGDRCAITSRLVCKVTMYVENARRGLRRTGPTSPPLVELRMAAAVRQSSMKVSVNVSAPKFTFGLSFSLLVMASSPPSSSPSVGSLHREASC